MDNDSKVTELLQAFSLVGQFFTVEEIEWFKRTLFKEIGFDLPVEHRAQVITLHPTTSEDEE